MFVPNRLILTKAIKHMSHINIAYYRVSTQKQGKSGLGLLAQKNLVYGFLKQEPDFAFTEIESGKGDGLKREQLSSAIDKCRELGGRLVIAKLDRLSRNVHFISGLRDSGIDFICCDNPHATPFFIHILAAFAEEEAKAISKRTKAGLKAKVKREIAAGNHSFKLGCQTGNSSLKKGSVHYETTRSALIASKKETAYNNKNWLKVKDLIVSLRDGGKHPDEIASILNKSKFKTQKGSSWSEVYVYKMIKRLEIESGIEFEKLPYRRNPDRKPKILKEVPEDMNSPEGIEYRLKSIIRGDGRQSGRYSRQL